MGQPEKPQLPFHEDFYYPFEYNLENIEACFLNCLNKSKFQPEDKERVSVALAEAKKLHENQTRVEAQGLPYVVHPIEVALEVLKLGGSPNTVIAALLHDVREDVDFMRRLENGEVAEKFGSRVVELLTRLLSKYRLEFFGISGKFKGCFAYFFERALLKLLPNEAQVVRLTDSAYFKKLEGDATAVFIKAIDRRKNLMSLGRMLDGVLDHPTSDPAGIINFVRKQITQTKDFVLPAVYRKYATLAYNLEALNLKLEIRLKIAEAFTAESTAQSSEFPVSRQLCV
ncbi:MAG: HD domain-containing protein [Candidatus Peribacteraceae bacterium]|nr:HD domain-containing protein [Candidatus Peribacteraceae bacterium]